MCRISPAAREPSWHLAQPPPPSPPPSVQPPLRHGLRQAHAPHRQPPPDRSPAVQPRPPSAVPPCWGSIAAAQSVRTWPFVFEFLLILLKKFGGSLAGVRACQGGGAAAWCPARCRGPAVPSWPWWSARPGRQRRPPCPCSTRPAPPRRSRAPRTPTAPFARATRRRTSAPRPSRAAGRAPPAPSPPTRPAIARPRRTAAWGASAWPGSASAMP